ncbi:manganese superoxide dismutase [Boletus reticuloceps]|uniref:Superoxide dismutase [Mn], mitochondrial n=1 Tax=Boletus reticuloceps TaxID=495285 RepID=A0A8I3A425_9AGAM|nr:manganese superoxide dismutase [Boletus reticuloceps]
MTHVLPELPYPYDALQPYISFSEQIIYIKAHPRNATPSKPLSSSTVVPFFHFCCSPPPYRYRDHDQVLMSYSLTVPVRPHQPLHSLFWTNLAPPATNGKGVGGKLKDGPLKSAIEASWGTVAAFIKEFNTTTAAIQGSGWGWLGYNSKNKVLNIVTTANQDPLLTHVPIIGVDIWEHAFYLQYLNVKVDYLNAIWIVINFEEAEKRYKDAVAGSKL